MWYIYTTHRHISGINLFRTFEEIVLEKQSSWKASEHQREASGVEPSSFGLNPGLQVARSHPGGKALPLRIRQRSVLC